MADSPLSTRKCDYCGGDFRYPDTAKKDTWGNFYAVPGGYYIPFTCPRCGGQFCDKHRLPENHQCTGRMKQTPSSPILPAHAKNRSNQHDYEKALGIDRHIEYEGPQPKTQSRFSQAAYNRAVLREKMGSYLKVGVVLFLILFGVYCFTNIEIITNVNSFVQAQTTTISSSLSSVGETVTQALTPQPVSISDVEKLILKYTNDERRKNGLKDLVWDEQLAVIAREHSSDMVKNNFFSHTNLGGEDPSARARRHGYPLYKSLGGGWYSEGLGENISKMPTGSVEGVGYVSNDPDSIAKVTVDSWMGSPGHRANILNSSYDKLGVGVAYDGLYYVATQDFW